MTTNQSNLVIYVSMTRLILNSGWTEEQFKAAGVRVVPPAVARRGSFQAKMSC
jgi:tetrahydrodipicolinate N-succinyltransferase